MNHLKNIQSRLVDKEILDKHIHRWKMLNQKVIFTNGCFDLLHKGHIYLLAKAKDLGGKLIVGLNSDESVKRLKGAGRPVKSLEERSVILGSLKMVDAIISFSEDTPLELIRWIEPDILVKGGDWQDKDIAGGDIVHALGGEVVIIPLVEGYSTSETERKIREANKINTL